MKAELGLKLRINAGTKLFNNRVHFYLTIYSSPQKNSHAISSTCIHASFHQNISAFVIVQDGPHEHVDRMSAWLVTWPPQFVFNVIKFAVICCQSHRWTLNDHLPGDVGTFLQIIADIFIRRQILQHVSSARILFFFGHLQQRRKQILIKKIYL